MKELKLNKQIHTEFTALMKEGAYIAALKLLREHFGYELKEAKDIVTAIRDGDIKVLLAGENSNPDYFFATSLGSARLEIADRPNEILVIAPSTTNPTAREGGKWIVARPEQIRSIMESGI